MHKWMWKTESRYYIVRLQANLFGEWTLVKSWGGLNNRLGGVQLHTFNTIEEAMVELGMLRITRVRRGYSTS